jgi:hypothetical protein
MGLEEGDLEVYKKEIGDLAKRIVTELAAEEANGKENQQNVDVRLLAATLPSLSPLPPPEEYCLRRATKRIPR